MYGNRTFYLLSYLFLNRFVVTHLNSLNGSMKLAQDKIINQKHSSNKGNYIL